jgi:inner membrane protein
MPRWLLHFVLPWLALTLVLGIDLLFGQLLFGSPRAALPVAATLDESAHLATALLLSRALGLARARPVAWGVAAGAVLVDVDHLPLELGWDFLTQRTNRPYTHSLLVVGGLVLLACLLAGSRRQLLLGAAFGLATHLVRDMATGGVPLLWPLAEARVTIPYGAYAAGLTIAATLATARARGGARSVGVRGA